MSNNNPPIVVTGGSVSIDFDEGIYKGSDGTYSNPDKVISRVEVVDGRGSTIFSQDIPDGKVTVTIRTVP